MFRPDVYQGKRKPENYFEGWYFKLVDEAEIQVWSVIPGVSFSEDRHAFIQVIEAMSGTTHYFKLPLESFSYRKDRFEIRLGNNFFSDSGMKLDLEQNDFRMSGQVHFIGNNPYPQRLLAPGIMGWYSYIPVMECYHGVVSMNHELQGTLIINERILNFSNGKGYIEKDWGTSMPSDWIWIQSNHFGDHPATSFMISVARIPWRKSFFPGFLSFLYHEGKIYRFATYNRSRIKKISLSEKEVHIVLQNRNYCLDVKAIPNNAGLLKAPRHGSMDREIFESLNSVLNLTLTSKEGKKVLTSVGKHAGIEIVGDVIRYFRD